MTGVSSRGSSRMKPAKEGPARLDAGVRRRRFQEGALNVRRMDVALYETVWPRALAALLLDVALGDEGRDEQRRDAAAEAVKGEGVGSCRRALASVDVLLSRPRRAAGDVVGEAAALVEGEHEEACCSTAGGLRSASATFLISASPSETAIRQVHRVGAVTPQHDGLRYDSFGSLPPLRPCRSWRWVDLVVVLLVTSPVVLGRLAFPDGRREGSGEN